jgi:hypothetical protein
MKNIFIAVLFLMISLTGLTQDSTRKWPLTAGINFTSVPTIIIAGTDTTYQSNLSMGPSLDFRSKGGFGVMYSPQFVVGGTHPGIFMHKITVGLEQYDKQNFDIVADYSHFFFTDNSSIPVTPISNEIIFGSTYKKCWFRPKLSAGVGFGPNKVVSASTTAYDIELAAGVNHSFEWNFKTLNFNLSPSVIMNAGTNEYFSFLSLSKYISHSKKFGKIIKNIHAKNSRLPASNSVQTIQRISVNNMELNLESSLETGSFSLRPSCSVFLPVSSASGSGIDGYWELTLTYGL